ncbi:MULTISPECIES: RagB/SusD family nutrient uptake outer membrane protein [Butyricimonas]|uniref:RagB/SusD family nutrient uptake outer membrane protein n=1 Tax=Butyricimonas TaxID=574697 RepID=UPI000371C18B|nr:MULTISPECIES: RagB/SusD family nutrient uptake outer membrane protein [Butyricimonas]
MKIYSRILAIVFLLSFTACESWLDVQQEGEFESEHLFAEGEGYRAVLNGLYKSMGAPNLYGRELSFEMLDCMSQQYDLSDDQVNSNDAYRDFQGFRYLNNTTRDMINQVWLSAFKVIANANDLIQNIEQASADQFRQGELERSLIMGEAYACRALMHFDMLRLFAPAPVNDDQQTYVPYVETYPNILATSIQVTPFLEKVIDDLKRAKELVAVYDTTEAGKEANATASARTSLPSGADYEDFFYGRAYRLNYYAIVALQARVYQYANRLDEAFACAKEVVEAGTQNGGKAFFTDNFNGLTSVVGDPDDPNGIATFDARGDYKSKSSVLFAAYNKRAYEDAGLGTYFRPKAPEGGGGARNVYFVVRREELFKSRGVDEWETDIRSKNLIFYAQGVYMISGKWYVPSRNPEESEHLRMSPVLRLTEMRYIMAEYYAKKGNFEEAYSILNDIREKRGLANVLTQRNSFAEFVTDLVEDARREWISEGQLFYLYKRLDAPFEQNRKLTKSEACLPLPADQK